MISGPPVDAHSDPNSNNRALAALCYLLVPLVSIIVLVSDSMKSNEFLRFHAVQAIGFAVAVGIYGVLATVFATVFTTVTLGFGACIVWILFLLPIAPWLYYTYLASQDKYFVIPWLTEFMVKQGWLTRPTGDSEAAGV